MLERVFVCRSYNLYRSERLEVKKGRQRGWQTKLKENITYRIEKKRQTFKIEETDKQVEEKKDREITRLKGRQIYQRERQTNRYN